PFSPRYAWVRDRFGMTWQLMLTDPDGDPRPFVIPSFMFGGTNHANAEEATDAWIALFDNSRRGVLYRYEDGGPLDAGTVMFTDFTLRGTWMAATDSGTFHDFTFTPGVSMIVSCRDQEEIDLYWAGLSAVPEAERCGWCVDRWGVSWQIVPHNIAELMANAATRDKILQMGKIDLTKL
ncbi:MAG: VOC family protein, partial [Rothia dentocariosa]